MPRNSHDDVSEWKDLEVSQKSCQEMRAAVSERERWLGISAIIIEVKWSECTCGQLWLRGRYAGRQVGRQADGGGNQNEPRKRGSLRCTHGVLASPTARNADDVGWAGLFWGACGVVGCVGTLVSLRLVGLPTVTVAPASLPGLHKIHALLV